ncbi:MAG: DUF58 domain-containing protein [Gammaproteobacteria bacterium]|nr:DUF58 domain-containing protein [Gammaproteobacteria bacterium]
MHNFIQQLKRFAQQSFIKADKRFKKPLLNNDEILDLLHRVQNNNKTPSYKHDTASRQIGDMRSIYRGHGMDYEESRHYQPGDDPRYMNWQLTARTGQQYMKVFREERQPGFFILVDRRNSMRFGTKQRLKITQAARSAAIAAFTAQENNFSVGGLILDNELQWFKENNNKQAVFEFIHQAARPALPVFHKQDYQEPKLDDALRMINEVLTLGSTIYLISDFHDINENTQPTLLQLSLAHQVHAIQITDPAELNLPKAGIIKLKDIMSNKYTDINSSSLSEQKEYKLKSNEYFSLKKKLFENISIPFHHISTEDDAIENKVVI